MPDASGNLPHHVFYGSILSELLRIARATLNYDDFLDKAKDLVRRMLRQGGEMLKITKLIDKINTRHSNALFSLNKSSMKIKLDLLTIKFSFFCLFEFNFFISGFGFLDCKSVLY